MPDLPHTPPAAPSLPPLAVALGALGFLPFLALGFLAVLPDPSHRHVLLLLAYAAVILAFLGGVHQGFAVIAPAPLPTASEPVGDWHRAARARLLGASLVAAIAWADLALALYLPRWLALLVMVIAFLTLAITEQKAAIHGWVPAGYMWLRWVLTLLVVLDLLAVLAIRVFGLVG